MKRYSLKLYGGLYLVKKHRGHYANTTITVFGDDCADRFDQ